MAGTSKSRRKLLLFIGVPLIIIIGLVVFALSGVNSFLKPVIKNALTKVLVNGSDSLYQFNLKDYTVTGGGRSIVFTGLELKVDSARYKLLQTAGLLPKTVVAVELDKATVSGLSAWQLWRKKNIICNAIRLEGARVNLLQQKPANDTGSSVKLKSLYELIKPDINNIDIGRIEISDADIDFNTVEQQTAEKVSWNFDSAAITLDDLLIDETTVNDTSRVLYAENMTAALGSLKLNSTDGLYKFSAKTTGYNFREKTAEIKDFRMEPAISQAEFNRRMGHEADFATIILPEIKIEGFNGGALINDKLLVASLIKLEEPSINLYKDRTAGPDMRSKMGKYPHQLLQKADMAINIRKLQLDKGKLVVTQKSPKTLEKGSFNFYNVTGAITNITNMQKQVNADKWCKADLTAGFLGNHKMHGVFNFDMAADDGRFITDATLASMSPKDINPIFRSLANAEMETFVLDELDYHVEGNDHYAVGNLSLRYHDMKLNVLKKDQDGEKKKKGLITALANLVKLYSDNPMKGEAERKARNIRFERQVNKNFFGLIIKTLLKCTQEIGIKGKNKTLPGF